MKCTPLFFLVVALCLLPSALPAQESPFDLNALKAAVDSSSSDFTNAAFYQNGTPWIGRLVALSGTIAEVPVVGGHEGKFVQLSGNGAYGAVNVVATIDSPLPTKASYTGTVPLITKGQSVRVLARVLGVDDFYDANGFTLHLPVCSCLAIYFSDDVGLQRPIWGAQNYRL